MELLKVKDLHTSFFTAAGEVKAVNGISFSLDSGKVLGIVGESGSGKSVTAYSIMQILSNPGEIVSGSIKFKGEELVGIDKEAMSKIRGNKISIIFQDPMTSLNPRHASALLKCSVLLVLMNPKSVSSSIRTNFRAVCANAL